MKLTKEQIKLIVEIELEKLTVIMMSVLAQRLEELDPEFLKQANDLFNKRIN